MAGAASFIPKNDGKAKRRVRVTRRIYLFSWVSYVFFFGTLLVTIAVFLFSIHLNNTLETTIKQLAQAKEQFSQADIESVRDLEKKLLVAEQVFSETAAPSALFGALESVVADPVLFSDLSYERVDAETGRLSFAAESSAFNDAIWQRQVIAEDPILQTAVIDGFSYAIGDNEEGGESDSSASALDVSVDLDFIATIPLASVPFDPTVYAEEEDAASGVDSVVTTEQENF